jgi:hypothetical protein
VAVADVDGDGFPDVITAPGRNTRPDIKVFRGASQAGLQGTLLTTISAANTFGTSFLGGVNAAAGDVDGDGAADIIVAPDLGKATIKVFHNRRLETPAAPQFVHARTFNAFPELKNYNGGARLAVGNVVGGVLSAQEVIVGTGVGVAGKIRVYDVRGGSPVAAWTRSDPTRFSGGLYVAAGDVNGDGIDDVISGAGAGGSGWIRVYDHVGTLVHSFRPFLPAENQNAALRVALRDVDGDGCWEILTTQAQDGRSGNKVKTFDALTGDLVAQFVASHPDLASGGLTIG